MILRKPPVAESLEIAQASKISVFNDGSLPGPENMRRDIELLHRSTEQRRFFARIYEWSGVWVSLGKSQSPNLVLRKPLSTPWVRRPTGGGAVLHGHDLTVSLAQPLREGTRELRTVYRQLVEPLSTALRLLGVRAAMAEDCGYTSQRSRHDCFLCASPNDVIDPATGRKLIGVAMRVTRSAALAQCSIPLRTPEVQPASVFFSAHTPVPLGIEGNELREAIMGALLSVVACCP